MKLNLLTKMTSVGRTLLLATLALISTAAVKAQSGTNFFNNAITTAGPSIDLGNASGGATGSHRSWAILALSGGVTITDPTDTYLSDPLSYDVLGNVGIGGNGILSMTNSWIKGRLWTQNNTSVPPSGPGFHYYVGSRVIDSSYISTAVSQANSASLAAAGLSNAVSGLIYSGGSIPGSIALSAAQAFTGVANTTYVINLTDLILSGSAATLTLNGTDTTNYIFNISRFMTLSNQAKIILGGGGITDANVLYNVKSSAPQYDVGLSGGAEAHGIILAPTRNVKLTGGSKLFGEVIAKGVSLSGVSKVINNYASP